MKQHRWIAVSAAILTAGCGNEAPPNDAKAPAGNFTPEPVVVYAAYADETYLPNLFADFTRDTGRRVVVRHRDAATIVDDLIADRGSPAADVLLTPSVYGVWKAATEGALRPLRSESISGTVPAMLRDPDGAWTAVSVNAATIVYDSEKIDADAIRGYRELGDSRFDGQLCLTSSRLPINRTLIAMLIAKDDIRPAERIVRQWVANLAEPPFATELQLVDALQDGRCVVAIVSSQLQVGSSRLQQFLPEAAHFDISGAGVARHARQPEAALQLIEWLVAKRVGTLAETKPRQDVSTVAWQIDEATKLAERARYP
ncbi:MAG: solute-binding protein [Woeseiaceae bacterium]|nr:solute-binding protein [Woeseiaceae bacterium]